MSGGRPGYRDFPGRRWLVVALRAGHLAGVVGVGAAVLATPVVAPDPAYVLLLVVAGAAMALLDAFANPDWLREPAGLSLLLKFALLAWYLADATVRLPLFWAILVFSVLFAHAPASFRHRRPGGG